MVDVRNPISFWDHCRKRLGSNRKTKPGRSRARPSRTLRCEALEDRALLSATYYVASGGNDAWDGLAGAYTSGTHGPWKTVAKVNAYSSFHAGDSVLFERGDTWREPLTTHSGDATGNITYAPTETWRCRTRCCWVPSSRTTSLTGPIWAVMCGPRLPR